MRKCDAAVITNNRIGTNLAINIDSKRYRVALYDVDVVIDGKASYGTVDPGRGMDISKTDIQTIYDIDSLIQILKEPAIVFLIGDTNIFADQILSLILNKLSPKDIIIDCCNSYFEDTAKRTRKVEQMGIYYLGTGFVGGEEGALNAPSLMIGGSYLGYQKAKNMLQDICLHKDNIYSCLYHGSDGSGQFVKMVHDAILWAVLQLISEHIGILRAGINCGHEQLHNILCDWNSKEKLNSALLDIISDITGRIDFDTQESLIDIVSDVVSFDLSSYWVGKSSMLLGVPVPTLIEAINVRYLSYMKNERQLFSENLSTKFNRIPGNEQVIFIGKVESSLYMSICCAYAQGFEFLAKASDMYGWSMSLKDVATSLKRGSYIQSKLLDRIVNIFANNGTYTNLFLDSNYLRIVISHLPSLRNIVSVAAIGGIPMSSTFSALSYIDALSKSILPTGIIQLCQDYIDGTGYEKLNEDGVFYADWQDPNLGTKSIKFKR